MSPALNDTVRDNEDYLDTDYKGIEFTGTKRFSQKWQMQAGFTIGKNGGGINTPPSAAADSRHERPQRSELLGRQRASSATTRRAFRLSGSYALPLEINLAGSLIANNGYPYLSTYSISRALARARASR